LSVADPAVSAVNGKLGAFGSLAVPLGGQLRLVERLEEGGNARVRRHGASSGNE
jgi:hypothetical protein